MNTFKNDFCKGPSLHFQIKSKWLTSFFEIFRPTSNKKMLEFAPKFIFCSLADRLHVPLALDYLNNFFIYSDI